MDEFLGADQDEVREPQNGVSGIETERGNRYREIEDRNRLREWVRELARLERLLDLFREWRQRLQGLGRHLDACDKRRRQPK